MERRVKAATIYGFAVMFIYGLAAVMIGTLLPEMIASFGLSLSRGGLIVTLQSLGGLLVLGLGIAFADRLSKSLTTLVSFGVLGILLLVTGLAGSYPVLLIAFLLSGAVLRILDTMLNAFIGAIRDERRGFFMNLLHTFFGIGAFCGPLFATAVLSLGGSWRTAYLIAALAFGLGTIPGVFILRRFPGMENAKAGNKCEEHKPPEPASGVLKGAAALIPAGLGLFFYGMHQSGVTAWLPYYMGAALGSGSALASGALSIYWAGIIISRLSASRLCARSGPAPLIMIGSLSGGILLGLGLFSSSPAVVIAASLASGILSGAVIPLFLTLIHGRYPLRTGSTTAVLMIFMLVGRLLTPWLMGAIADTGNPAAAMLVTAAALVLCGLMAPLSRVLA